MSNMKAIVKQSAKPDDFVLMQVPIPEISEIEILVRIKAIGVGIHDGYYLPGDAPWPYTIGIEGAGIIEKKGSNITNFQVGDRIAFVSSMQLKGGTWAEYAVVAGSSLIVSIPEEMSFAQAAAIPVAGIAALKAVNSLQLKKNDSLFIAGASGAIGTFVIQLAVAQGCIVAASASKINHEYMQSLGATITVDYHDLDWINQIKQRMTGGVDAAIAIQPNTAISSINVVKDGGEIISVSGEQLTSQRNITIVPYPHTGDMKGGLIDLMNRVTLGEVKLLIEQTYGLDKALEVLKKMGTRHARGKSVIVVP